MCKLSVECEMQMIVWPILTVLSSSIPSMAQPVLVAGRYVLPITQHDLYVSAPGALGTTVTVNFRFKPIGSCTDTLDSVLEYQLPPGYKGEPVSEAKATCNRTIKCSGIEFKWLARSNHIRCHFSMCRCGKSRPVVVRFPERIGTFHLRSNAPRTPLLRRASVGNFEVVDESADKKTKTVRFRFER